MKKWILAAVIATVGGFGLVGCETEPAKPCHGENCVSDAEITANIQREIKEHAELTDWTIDVQTINGMVYLHGLVDTSVQRDLVESIAHDVRGVMGVENSIELRNMR